jgi:hypothetical protein
MARIACRCGIPGSFANDYTAVSLSRTSAARVSSATIARYSGRPRTIQFGLEGE